MIIILIDENGRLQKQRIADILYVEVVNGDLRFHTPDSAYRLPQTLGEWEVILAKEGYVRASRRALVNINLVKKYDNVVKIAYFDKAGLGKGVKVSRRKAKEMW
ncbi:LytTR family DNA-binding domain-containing protein [Paenibacillus sp. FSL P4-0127]|uniref:LytTR family DNA-binding domain-containing protein n=1 Tax=unclassified Paenibacillus TaxID=185978 RepID=UPI004040A996